MFFCRLGKDEATTYGIVVSARRAACSKCGVPHAVPKNCGMPHAVSKTNLVYKSLFGCAEISSNTTCS